MAILFFSSKLLDKESIKIKYHEMSGIISYWNYLDFSSSKICISHIRIVTKWQCLYPILLVQKPWIWNIVIFCIVKKHRIRTISFVELFIKTQDKDISILLYVQHLG